MLFSSNIFIFLFLPIYLGLYYFINTIFRNKKISNLALFGLSVFFYLWGNGSFFYLLLLSILINYILGKYLERSKFAKPLLAIGIIFNLSFLFYFKYTNFFHIQITELLSVIFHIQLNALQPIYLPIGISFYTFMAISYLFDIFRKKYKSTSLLNFGLYLSLFPHLVAGPIVRYSEIGKEIITRKVNIDSFFEGVTRFCYGLAKKVILANTLGGVSDQIFSLPHSELSLGVSWVGILCYTLQIFFDFSGYTDMAIGLAKLFGFDFPENFNNPYRSSSLTEFWRRWHMTLRNWFLDYVYIPLGGSRKGSKRTYVNLFIVFALTGLWHGAAWTFVIWGVYNGLILITERFLEVNYSFKTKGVVGNLLTLLLVMIGWVFFRSTTISDAYYYLLTMFGLKHPITEYLHIFYYLNNKIIFLLLIALILVFLPIEKIHFKEDTIRFTLIKSAISIICLVLSILILSKTQFNPFIYFQF